MTRHRMRLWTVGATSLLAFVVISCVDEKVVYRDQASFTAPPAEAANFLGYSDEATKTTVCGNCHAGQQAWWLTTKHASAWEDLQGSGHASGTCEACHTVNNQGNIVTDTAVGWRSTKDTRYLDVQCEACHGPGLNHVSAPQKGQMLASIHVDTGTAVTDGCAECHQGTHHPFTEEWRLSRHAEPNSHTFASATATSPDVPFAPRTSCRGCHVGQYILAAWGVNTDYQEKNLATNIDNSEGITCVVCHDPHGKSGLPHQLRFDPTSSDQEQNLCAKCHQRSSNPDWSSSRGTSPHSPQGPLVLGTAGWWPEGFQFDSLQSSHGPSANPGLCVTCHLATWTATDQVTGGSISVVGHRFIAIPCVDAGGVLLPPDQQDCNDTQRSFQACATGGCHGGSPANARSAYSTATSFVNVYAGALNSMIAQVPSDQFATGLVNSARGALFNANLALSPGSVVHNPPLIVALLQASMQALHADYGIAYPPGISFAPYQELLKRMGN